MQADSYTYKYRVCFSSWGIAIDIEAKKAFRSDSLPSYNIINDYLYVEKSLSWLSDTERYFLSKSTDLIEGSISECLNSDHIVLIQNIEFNFTDYQEEGLAMALAGWFGSYFNVGIKDIEIKFNKELNKYIFNFED